jgi:predicted Zn-dependent protease
MTRQPRLFPLLLAAFALAISGCATSAGTSPDSDYLRYVWVEVPVNEKVLLRWSARKMPLKVHLPAPPAAISSDPEAVHDVVRDGILDWTDAAGPGLPRFVFVEDPGEADIPIVWADEPGGDWFIAHCVYDIDPSTRRFGVARILVATHVGGEQSLGLLYLTMLHEMGHALGLTGHSPAIGDIMYRNIRGETEGLSARDRETLRRLYEKPVGSRVVGARSADR